MNRISRFLSPLVALATLAFILLTATRILITPLYPVIEYRTPGFPEDPFGFTLQDRLQWADYSIRYLINSADISYLGDLKFADGSALFNERELEHMVDVKNLVQTTFKVWYGLLVALPALWFLSRRGGWSAQFWQAVSRGGFAIIGLIAVILVFVTVSFNQLFVFFHSLFFQSGTWTFEFSDTLIRLFPLPFWRDAFIGFGILSLAGGLLAGFLGRRLSRS